MPPLPQRTAVLGDGVGPLGVLGFIAHWHCGADPPRALSERVRVRLCGPQRTAQKLDEQGISARNAKSGVEDSGKK